MSESSESSAYSLGVVILAAGASSRMGQAKMLLPWGTTSIIGYLIKQWQSLAASQIAVVCASGDYTLKGTLDRLGFSASNRILNPAPADGMFSSILRAARWTGWMPGLTHWVIGLGDQPHLSQSTLEALTAFSRQQETLVCQPRYQGQLGHPILLPKHQFFRLGDTPATTLKDFLRDLKEGLASVDVDDPGLLLDIDQPADYERLRPRQFSNS